MSKTYQNKWREKAAQDLHKTFPVTLTRPPQARHQLRTTVPSMKRGGFQGSFPRGSQDNSKRATRPRSCPRGPQDRLQETPKTSQDEAFFRITFPYLFWPNLSPKRPPKTTPFGDPNRPKIVPRRVLRPLFFKKVDFSKNERRLGREHDFDPPEVPRWGQDRPKIAPRRS